ncbi:MAG TPA: ATP synthase F1 subunit gamma [Humisphaera sp.]|jgi:F-type H+-transporting ATPase subunit gamma|nr:ATP synthase F1 subunit gamma [Humisphaera sp.]
MLSVRDIRRRIRSIRSTAQITKAMQMVAASKMRKAQQAALAGRPFVQLLYRMQRKATTQAIDFVHPLLEARPVRKRAVILISTDKGLCGGLNSNLFRMAADFDTASTVFIVAGRKAAQFVARTRRNLAAEFTYSDTPRFAEASAIASMARDMFLKGEVDEVRIVATRFINTLTQRPVTIEYLPVGEIASMKLEGAESEEQLAANTTQFQFEPDAKSVLGYLIPHYLNVYLFQVLLNAKASEQSARMVSMKNATDNAQGLIKDLTLEYNKLRQGNITRELLDIAGGKAGSE